MKMRNGFVSNSSSSSFIVKKDLSDKGISCLKLTDEQLKLMDGYKQWEEDKETFHPEPGQDYYLTEFISDCDERWGEIRDMDGAFEYASGGHGGPYDEEDYNEYSGEFASVWLHKEHDVAKQMSFGQFVCDFLADFGNSDVIVKYEKDSIVLMRVELNNK